MSHTIVVCNDVVIPTGTNVSVGIPRSQVYDDAEDLLIAAPSTLVVGEAGTIQISFDNVNWFDLLDKAAAAVAYPAASKAKVLLDDIFPLAPYFRLKVTAGNVAADRAFKLAKKVHMA